MSVYGYMPVIVHPVIVHNSVTTSHTGMIFGQWIHLTYPTFIPELGHLDPHFQHE